MESMKMNNACIFFIYLFLLWYSDIYASVMLKILHSVASITVLSHHEGETQVLILNNILALCPKDLLCSYQDIFVVFFSTFKINYD